MKVFKTEEFKKTLVDFKYAHRQGRDSALDDTTREYHRGAFIAIGYIFSLMRKPKFYEER